MSQVILIGPNHPFYPLAVGFHVNGITPDNVKVKPHTKPVPFREWILWHAHCLMPQMHLTGFLSREEEFAAVAAEREAALAAAPLPS